MLLIAGAGIFWIGMEGMGVSMDSVGNNRQGGEERYFTPKKFLHTGRELAVEACASLHTGRGKMGVAIFLLGLIWGIFGIATKMNMEEWNNFVLISDLWCAMGLTIIFNLQNHKLLYLLPVSRKGFASMQMQKMAWSCLILFGISAMQYGNMGLGTVFLWKNIFWKAIPASISLGVYQIGLVQPIRGKTVNGTKLFGLSYLVLFLDLGIASFNLVATPSFGNILDFILPFLNYGISIYATVYCYRKVAFAELYYDEM